jgi:predicted acetyltransferase
MNEAANPDASIQVIPAALAQKSALANLLELYMHDFCDFLDIELRSDGRFGYKELDLYWSDPDRHPFLVYVDGKLAGLVLVRGLRTGSHATMTWDMAEFFIVRSYRRRGIGACVAQHIFRRFPGAWDVRVMGSNEAAYRFWLHAIKGFAGEGIVATRVQRGGKDWHGFSFESNPRNPEAGKDVGE